MRTAGSTHDRDEPTNRCAGPGLQAPSPNSFFGKNYVLSLFFRSNTLRWFSTMVRYSNHDFATVSMFCFFIFYLF